MDIKKENKYLVKIRVAGILTFIFGVFGLHKFVLGEWKIGIVYLLFSWTGVPAVLSIIDGAKLLMLE